MELLNTLSNQGFSFLAFAEHVKNRESKSVILRYDIDKLPLNSLKFARIQSKFGINGTYYFRVVHESFDENIIQEIARMGHEIGYHYEDLGITAQKHKGIKA